MSNAGRAAKSRKMPSIVFVLTDQWRAAATGYNGDPNVKTPHLDALASEALDFQNAVSVCPVCTPYRAALMTGRFPTTSGMFLNDAYLPPDELCMAEIFAAAGYDTGYIGKWHLDGHGRHNYIPPERRQGWDYWKAAECDHNYNHSHYYTGRSDTKRFWKGYDAFAQTRDAQQFISDHAAGDKPYVLVLSYGSPHFPHHTAPERFQAMYPPEEIELPPNVPQRQRARAKKESQGYYAHCTALDQCIGDLLKTIEESGDADETIVVFTSDHGEMMGSHDCRPWMKHVPYSEAAQVPFLLRYPGVYGREGRQVETPLTTVDILPTLLGLAGIEIPARIEGEDLSLSLREKEGAADRAALYMGVAPWVHDKTEYRAIRTRRYTYVRNLEGPWMLYDDSEDRFQMNNLVGDAEHSDLVDELDTRLQSELRRIGDGFHPAEWYIAEWGFDVASHGSCPYGAKEWKGPQAPRRHGPS